jgi:hypothetical protein
LSHGRVFLWARPRKPAFGMALLRKRSRKQLIGKPKGLRYDKQCYRYAVGGRNTNQEKQESKSNAASTGKDGGGSLHRLSSDIARTSAHVNGGFVLQTPQWKYLYSPSGAVYPPQKTRTHPESGNECFSHRFPMR